MCLASGGIAFEHLRHFIIDIKYIDINILQEHHRRDADWATVSGTGEPGDSCQQVQKKNGEIAHRTILPTSWNRELLRN